jgi:Protein of unknown function (DUF3305)
MPSQLSFPVSVVMEKIAISNRWQPFTWQPAGVLPDDGAHGVAGESLALTERELDSGTNEVLAQTLWPGFVLDVFADEAEGYFLNMTSPEPCVFVMWRTNEDSDVPFPHSVTLSYNEAARWMDAQEKVDTVPMPTEISAMLSDWVAANYKPPEKKQRIRPKSFESKEGRYDSSMSGMSSPSKPSKEKAS